MKNHVHKEAPPGMKHHRNYGKYLYTAFLVFTLIACNVQPVMAATIWDKASEIMKDVYNQIILISTIAAVVTASVALLLMNFSKSGKTVDESRAWLKRIIITWAILNGLGFIMAYITPFFAGGQWNVYDVLMETEDTKRLAHILNRLVHGSASSFNQQTNVDLTNKYTVLDISELTGSSDLLTVGMFVALDYVWDKAKENRTEEKAIFVDEVWQLIGASSNRLAAEFVLEIAKIIRAYSGAGIFATQDLNDFFALDDGKYGKGIINNCKTKIILNMEDEEAQRVKTILRLSETEVMNITHFQRGNGLISTNNNNITVEFKASNLEKELITTDRQELLEILKRQDKKVG